MYLYIDGTKIAGTATVSSNGTTAATWSVSISSANQLNLSPGIQVTASILPSAPAGICESQQTAAQTVTCYAPSSSPVITTTSQTICRGNVATVTITGVEDGVIYQLYNGETATGPSAVGDLTASTSLTLTSGPLAATTTLKVRAFRVGSASCTVTLNGSSVITVNPGPNAFNVTPTSSNVCNGSTAMVSLSGSESGTSYRVQVYDANTDTYVNSGEAVTGTGSAIHLTTAALSTSGTFKVVATSGSCTVDMGNTFTVFVPANNLTLTPATRSICNGATASVTIKSSQAGVTYQLFNGTTASGSAVAGTGGDLTLTTGALTTVGTTTFKVVGTTSSPACSVELTQTFAVTVTPALTTPNITLTSTNPLCDGGTATIRVNSSQLGVTYQIYNGNYTSGSAVVGTGGDIVLTSANLTASTTLTVRASNTCGNTLTSNGVAVTVTAIQAYTVSPTSASICSGSTFTVTLANSTASTTYTLKYYNPGTRTFVDFSPVVSKTNTSTQSGALTLTAPALSANTTLKVVATSGSCAKDMLNTVDVSVSSTTVTFSTSTQKICAGSAASVTILNSQYGAIYQLQTVTGTTPTYTNTGASVTGTGGDITLTSAAFNTNSTNTLRVLVTPSGCPAFGSSTFTVTVASPTAQTVTRDTPASICSGSTSTLSLAASELGVTYQIYANNVAVGLPVQGNGGKISLTTSPLTSTTTLKVVASQSGCSNVDMTNSYTITVGTPNTVFTVAPASQNICANGTAQVSLSGSQSGVYYQLYNGNTATGAQVAGTGSAITLTSGALTANATLTVVALSANACGNTTMDGFSAVTVSPMPLKPTVTSSASTLCGTGNVTFTVGNLVNGVSYQLYKDGVAQNSPITYTGSNAISFTSAISAATTKFTVVATNGTCTPATSDEVTITSVTLATPVIALDNATVCKGNSALLSVTNPANGVVYKLYKDNVYTNLSVTAANGTATFSVNTAGVYKVVATSSGCESLASNTATLTVTEAPSTYALASAATQNVCRGSKATISIAGSEQGVVYQLVNLSTNEPTGTPVTGNGSMIFLYTDAITVDGTYNLKVTATNSTCGFTTEMGETSVIVAECPIMYEVEPPYTKVTYTTNEVIATPVLTGWTYTGPLTYTVIEGTPLTGTSVDPVTGKLYVSTSTMSTLQSGTRTLRILATDQLGATRTTYMTYSINDADADGYERAGGIEVLPVQLISFSATPTVAGVQLKWSTASEKDNDFFQIERSQDGRTFTAVGKVQGNGNSNTVKQYGYLDATTTAKTQYYRLKQVDYDGKFEYSRVISAAAGKTVTPAQPLVFPNPFVKEFTLSLTSETAMNVTVELRDLQNRVVKTQKAVLVKGNNHLPLTTDNLPAGTYLLNVTGNGLRLVQKVIKTN
ncbi:T9SS type A sorting domain-containing protein [Rufibacter ruber]|uniref:Ig-like domain-containing protein n=1 Tax=Rufibacter ruber TaxID=1783499 RepID=UPI00128FDC50|nr:T9SS type A sorting domain-containing protein [Rufibacter ruber]